MLLPKFCCFYLNVIFGYVYVNSLKFSLLATGYWLLATGYWLLLCQPGSLAYFGLAEPAMQAWQKLRALHSGEQDLGLYRHDSHYVEAFDIKPGFSNGFSRLLLR
ncbi:MAG: hypothetical protein RQ714_09315 [Nitrosomonas sp.]|nr:hypothetical protein [Nitrosomonas sp.]